MRRPQSPLVNEGALHRQVAQFLSVALTAETWWTTFPLGGGGQLRGAILRGRGVRKGTPDVLLIHGGRPFWIELKTQKGTVSDEQYLCHDQLLKVGAAVALARSLDDVVDQIIDWGIPTKLTYQSLRSGRRRFEEKGARKPPAPS